MTHGCRPERSHGATGAGLALLAQLDRRLGLMARFAACLEDRRGQRFVEHTLLEQFRQRVYQIACGYEDCNDADARRVWLHMTSACPERATWMLLAQRLGAAPS